MLISNRNLFYGTIATAVDVDPSDSDSGYIYLHEYNSSKVCVKTLKIMSGTWLMDNLLHFRTFQNSTQTYAQVMEIINRDYTDSDFFGIDAGTQPDGRRSYDPDHTPVSRFGGKSGKSRGKDKR